MKRMSSGPHWVDSYLPFGGINSLLANYYIIVVSKLTSPTLIYLSPNDRYFIFSLQKFVANPKSERFKHPNLKLSTNHEFSRLPKTLYFISQGVYYVDFRDYKPLMLLTKFSMFFAQPLFFKLIVIYK